MKQYITSLTKRQISAVFNLILGHFYKLRFFTLITRLTHIKATNHQMIISLTAATILAIPLGVFKYLTSGPPNTGCCPTAGELG